MATKRPQDLRLFMPKNWATSLSSIRVGISRGIVQFMRRFGTIAIRTLGRGLVRARQTAFPITSGAKPLIASPAEYLSNFANASANGVFRNRSVTPASAFCQIGVTTGPGRMIITSIPNRISSRRKVSERPSRPNFDAV